MLWCPQGGRTATGRAVVAVTVAVAAAAEHPYGCQVRLRVYRDVPFVQTELRHAVLTPGEV